MTRYRKLPGYDAPAPAADTSQINAINSSGVAVGNYFDAAKREYGYVVRGGTSQPETLQVAGLDTQLFGIDDAGDVIGNYQDPSKNTYFGFAQLPTGKNVELDDALPIDAKGKGATIIAASRTGEVTGTYGNDKIFIAHLGSDGFEGGVRKPAGARARARVQPKPAVNARWPQ